MSSESILGDTSSGDRASDIPLAIRFDSIEKTYDIARTSRQLRSAIPWADQTPREPKTAISDISLDVPAGATLGLVGPNGAGKSTLLKLAAGVTDPTSGTVTTRGRVGSMIELGIGFHPDLTGWENIRLSATLLDAGGILTNDLLEEIAEFSGIVDVLGEPLTTYSTGMEARLGFAIATHIPVDILLIDEVLAVGDRDFQEKCIDRIQELVLDGTTLLFVSHDTALISIVCEEAIQVRQGQIIDQGPSAEVVERYLVRSGSRYRTEDDPPMHFVSFDPTPSPMEPWAPLEIGAELVVERPVTDPRISVDMYLPFIAPDIPVVGSIQKLPALRRPGRYSVTGVSTPYPGDKGQMRVVTSLIDGSTQTMADHRATDVFVGNDHGSGKPHLAVDPRWQLERIADQSPDGSTSRPVVPEEDGIAVLKGATKLYGRRGIRGAMRMAIPLDWGLEGRETEAAVDNLDLVIEEGSALGVIGPNGAGKTTLLRLLAGLTRPDTGSINVRGRVVPILELGAGFHQDLTGRENVFVSAGLYGLSAAEVAAAMDDIIESFGHPDAIDLDVKRYSSGMRARLGFALAMNCKPDLLLLDELLTVGDEEFRRQAIATVNHLRNEGSTLVFVSHELALVEQICDRTIRLENGRLVDDGPSEDVIDRYGGVSWSAGTKDAISSVRVHDLTVAIRSIPSGGVLRFHGMVEVTEPSPEAKIELSYRTPPDDRSARLTEADLRGRTLFVTTVEPENGHLSSPGWYRFEASIDRNEFAGEVDLVVSVVDARENTPLTEAWKSITVGAPRAEGFPGPVLDFTWTCTEVDEHDE